VAFDVGNLGEPVGVEVCCKFEECSRLSELSSSPELPLTSRRGPILISKFLRYFLQHRFNREANTCTVAKIFPVLHFCCSIALLLQPAENSCDEASFHFWHS
jgi:hypothetical protein